MFGAIAKAFGATGKAAGKAAGKGAKSGIKTMGSNIKKNVMPPTSPIMNEGGIGTDPSTSFMDKFRSKLPGGVPGAMDALANAGQPEPMNPQQPPDAMGGFMNHMGPLVQKLLQNRMSQSQPPSPQPQGMGMPPGINPGMGGMGMDVGPSMPFEQMYGRGRMRGMY